MEVALLASRFAFLAAFFSFGVMAAFFFCSLLLRCSLLPMFCSGSPAVSGSTARAFVYNAVRSAPVVAGVVMEGA